MPRSLLSAAGRAALTDDIVDAGGPVGIGRRFGVLSLVPSAGTSSVAALVARAFARARAGRVLLARTGASASEAPRHDAASAARDRRFADLPTAVRDRVRWRDGVFALDAVGADPVAAVERWQDDVVPLTRHFDVTVVDWPTVHDPGLVLDRATIGHAVCLVTPDRRDVAERTLLLADELSSRGAAPVVAFVDVDGRRSTWPRLLADAGHRVVAVPHRAPGRESTSRSTARAATALSALLMRAANEAADRARTGAPRVAEEGAST